MAQVHAALMRLNLFITQKMRENNVPAVSVAITDRDTTLFRSAYGVADVAGRMPSIQDTLFEIGSITKSFTAIALLQEVDAGRFDLHAPINDYLTWFQIKQPKSSKPITAHHLLSHTAGIIAGTDFSGEHRYEVVALRDQAAVTSPGKYFHYSNVGYKILTLILEQITGHAYEDIIQTRILNPLGMTMTAAAITQDIRPRLAVGYCSLYDDRPAPKGRPLAPAAWLQYSGGDGSVASTPGDMAIYMRMLLNRGQGSDGRLLSEESFDLLTRRIIRTQDAPLSNYGYGLAMGKIDGCLHIGHNGSMVGYSSTLLLDVDTGLGIIVLTNHTTNDTFGVADVGLRMLRMGLKDADLPPLPVIPDPWYNETAPDYVGVYRQGERTLRFVEENNHLFLDYDYDNHLLERRGPDTFYVPHPDFSLHLLVFGRNDGGRVVELFHGGDWYVNDTYRGPTTFDYPAEWNAYSGMYRSYNPWSPVFRVVLRKGMLLMVEPAGDTTPLVPLPDGSFQIGGDARSPERLRFDTLIDSKALRAVLSGCEYYRFFTP